MMVPSLHDLESFQQVWKNKANTQTSNEDAVTKTKKPTRLPTNEGAARMSTNDTTNEDAARMSRCQGSSVPDETYTVDVPFPSTRSSSETRADWNCCCMHCRKIISLLFVVGITLLILYTEDYCHQQPGMALESLSIRNMTAYPTTTNSTGTTAVWQVDSAFDIGLSTWNPNSVPKCFTTFRRMYVRVEYRGQTILRQEVPLGFGLQPQKSQPVLLQVEGKNFLLKKSDLGPVMETEIRSGDVELDVYFDARYLRNDRRAEWAHYGCMVDATSPGNSSSYLLRQRCY